MVRRIPLKPPSIPGQDHQDTDPLPIWGEHPTEDAAIAILLEQEISF
jgi:hypothetical protein